MPLRSESTGAAIDATAGITTTGNVAVDAVEDRNVERMDAATVANLYRLHADELRCFLLGVLSDLDLANEVLQATFAKTVDQGHTAREESLKGWLFRVAFNEALTYRRRQTVRNKAVQKLGEAGEREMPSPADLVLRGEAIEGVRAALKHLSDEHQQLIRLRIYEEKTYATMATELGLPLGTIYGRMQLALKLLREHLEE